MVVVVGGKYPTPCKKGGGIVRAGEMSGGMCPGGCPDPIFGVSGNL